MRFNRTYKAEFFQPLGPLNICSDKSFVWILKIYFRNTHILLYTLQINGSRNQSNLSCREILTQ